jgi:hypothetical protein
MHSCGYLVANVTNVGYDGCGAQGGRPVGRTSKWCDARLLARVPSALVVGLVLAATSAGCRAHGRDQQLPSGSPSLSSDAAASAVAERKALAAYRGMWAAFVKAARTANPDEPDLRWYTAGQARTLIVGGLRADRDHGRVTRGEVATNPRVSQLTPSGAPKVASITDCASDAKWLVYRKDGGLVDNVPGGNHRVTATAKSVDGSWKVTFLRVGGVGTC